MDRLQRSPLVRRLMRDYDVSVAEVARAADLDARQVEDALNFERFRQCPFLAVARIHGSVEKKLREHGWTGRSRELWEEFDRCLGAPGRCAGEFDPPA